MSTRKLRTPKSEFSARTAVVGSRLWPGAPARWLLGTLLLGGILIGGAYAVWRHVGPSVLAHEDYQVRAGDIVITPPPPWIRTDLKSDVLHSGGLNEPLSLLEPELGERLAAAFSLHPWVAEVLRVEKSHPAGVEVTLRYRKPVCMVEVPGGLYPVDAGGVLLPSDDFSPFEAARYPRLSGIRTVPLGPVGTSWEDTRVSGGARVAAALFELWDEFSLARIVPSAATADSNSPEKTTFDIFTRGGSRILWGTAPQKGTADDPRAAAKIARLNAYVSKHGSLDRPRAAQLIDVRDARESTARRPRATTQKDEPKR